MGYETFGTKPSEQEIAFAYRQRSESLRASDRSYDLAVRFSARNGLAATWQKLVSAALEDAAFAFKVATETAHLTNDVRDEVTAGEMSLRIRQIAGLLSR